MGVAGSGMNGSHLGGRVGSKPGLGKMGRKRRRGSAVRAHVGTESLNYIPEAAGSP